MADHIFPEEILDNSQEEHFSRHSIRTQIIYTVVLISIIAAFLAISFIKVAVSVRSNGIIKSIVDRNQLKAMVSGKIKNIYIRENKMIEQGEKALEIASPQIDKKLRYNRKRQEKVERYLHDLQLLQNRDSIRVLELTDLSTTKYQRSYLEFKQQVYNHLQQISQAQKKFSRNKQLYERNVLSKASFEQSTFNLKSEQNAFKLQLRQQLHEWLSQKLTYQDELNKLRADEGELVSKKQQYIIRAPITGTILNMQGLYEGSIVSANQRLAVISPDTGLIAECYVPPSDIGLIRKGMKTRINVSAYDFRQWGLLEGMVQDISNDVTVVDDQPVFKVQSTLSQPYLELKNRYRGDLKKGMAIQVRFVITQRSLFQLLFDNIDNWVNPKWNTD